MLVWIKGEVYYIILISRIKPPIQTPVKPASSRLEDQTVSSSCHEQDVRRSVVEGALSLPC